MTIDPNFPDPLPGAGAAPVTPEEYDKATTEYNEAEAEWFRLELERQINELETERDALRREVASLREALTKIDNLRNMTKVKVISDPLDMTPDNAIDSDGFALMTYHTKKALLTAANMARDGLAAPQPPAQAEAEGRER